MADSGEAAIVKSASKIWFRVPGSLLVLLALILFGPRLAAALYVVTQHPEIRWTDLLLLGAPGVAIKATALLLMALVRVPIVATFHELKAAWFFRTTWSDVEAATLRRTLGFSVLEIRRRGGRPWRFWLAAYPGLPEFLAEHAPEGNPLRQLRADDARAR